MPLLVQSASYHQFLSWTQCQFSPWPTQTTDGWVLNSHSQEASHYVWRCPREQTLRAPPPRNLPLPVAHMLCFIRGGQHHEGALPEAVQWTYSYAIAHPFCVTWSVECLEMRSLSFVRRKLMDMVPNSPVHELINKLIDKFIYIFIYIHMLDIVMHYSLVNRGNTTVPGCPWSTEDWGDQWLGLGALGSEWHGIVGCSFAAWVGHRTIRSMRIWHLEMREKHIRKGWIFFEAGQSHQSWRLRTKAVAETLPTVDMVKKAGGQGGAVGAQKGLRLMPSGQVDLHGNSLLSFSHARARQDRIRLTTAQMRWQGCSSTFAAGAAA